MPQKLVRKTNDQPQHLRGRPTWNEIFDYKNNIIIS
jgi:hypothetical protein